MNRSKLHLLRNMAAAVLLCAGFVSCSQDDLDGTQGKTFQPGEYPLELTAAGLDGVVLPANAPAMSTRGTVGNDWGGVSQVAVMENGASVAKLYTATSSSGGTTATLTSTDPYYWTTSSETKSITAWHPYSKAYPATWKVEANQNINNGYQASDLIKATASLGFSTRTAPITFKHQTAKVIVNLIPDGVTLDGNTTVKLLGIDGVKSGTTITAYKQMGTTYLALLCGQEIEAGNGFIQVEVGSKKFVYTPTAAKTLVNGTVYTYNITVKNSGIEVAEATGGTWTSGGSENVGVKEVLVAYTATDVKKGDYLYADGTTSDGGLRKIYLDGTMVSEAVKPQPKAGKTVVGIVFWTPSETDYTSGRKTPARLTDDKIMSAAYPNCTHGLAVAVKALTYKSNKAMVWQPYGSYEYVKNWQAVQYEYNPSATDFVSVSSNFGATDKINRIYGYQNTIVLRAYNVYCLETSGKANFIVQPVAALDELVKSNACPAPANSTGWFLPSVKELYMLRYKDVDKVYSSSPNNKIATRDIVNSSLDAVGGDKLGADCSYWSSSEGADSSLSAYCMKFDDVQAVLTGKYGTLKARAVCAF